MKKIPLIATISIAVITFALGAFIGVLVDRRTIQGNWGRFARAQAARNVRENMHDRHNDGTNHAQIERRGRPVDAGARRARELDRLQESLALSDAQTSDVKRILDAYRLAMNESRSNFFDSNAVLMEQVRRDVAEILDDVQLEKFNRRARAFAPRTPTDAPRE